MASHHKHSVYAPLPLENPFDKQDAVYGNLLSQAEQSKKTWRRAALIAQVMNIASLLLFFYAINLQKFIPLVVTVSPWGEANYVGDISALSYQNTRIPDTAIQYQIRDFITKLRSISTDPEVLYNNITDCYAKVTPGCADRMTKELRQADPFSEVGKLKRTISLESVLRLSSSTWQADWIEAASNGSPKRYRGVFTIQLLEPPAKQRVQNPLGIYIDNYDITEL
jgi:type IV secretion system protein VirB5